MNQKNSSSMKYRRWIAGIVSASLLLSGGAAVSYAEEAAAAASVSSDEEYANLVEGGLNKEELEFVLDILPWYMNESGWTSYDQYLPYLINEILDHTQHVEASPISVLGQGVWSASDMTRIFSSFSDLVFSEENSGTIQSIIGNSSIVGDNFSLTLATPSRSSEAQIISAEYTSDEMIIHFALTQIDEDDGTVSNMTKKAILKRSETGKYKITAIADDVETAAVEASAEEAVDTSYEEGYEDISIEDLEEAGEVSVEEMPAEESADSEAAVSAASSASGVDMASVYGAVLDQVQNGAYTFLTEESFKSTSEGYEYLLQDINQDGIQELIVGELFTMDVFYAHAAKVFTLQQTDSGYSAVEVPIQTPMEENICYLSTVLLPEDGNGLIENSVLSRGTGECQITRDVMQDGVFIQNYETVMGYQLGDDLSSYLAANPMASWMPVSDRSLLTT